MLILVLYIYGFEINAAIVANNVLHVKAAVKDSIEDKVLRSTHLSS